jgi:hypothetical protein
MAFKVKYTDRTESHLDRDLAGSVEAGIQFAKLSFKKPELCYWMKPIHPPRAGVRTLTLDTLNTWEYTLFRPMDSVPTSRNIERVATLAHPILRAALPALGNGAPDHLGYEVCCIAAITCFCLYKSCRLKIFWVSTDL